MNHTKGFTLIEIMVVIAIIGILASIVLAAVSSARKQGKDGSAMQSITSIRSQAELCYNGGATCGSATYGTAGAGNVTGGTPSGLSGACNDTQVVNLLIAASAQLPNTTAVNCNVGLSGKTYIVWTTLNTQTAPANFCIDSTGFAGNLAIAPAATAITGDVKCR